MIMKLFDMLAKKLNIRDQGQNIVSGRVSNPLSDTGNEFINRMSKHALKLYEKQCDIKNFTKLAMSDPENTSHNELVEKLLKEDVLDPLSDEIIHKLVNNKDFLDDLGL